MLHCALAQFPPFTDEQTGTVERRDLPQIFKLVVGLGLEPPQGSANYSPCPYMSFLYTHWCCLVLLPGSSLEVLAL